MDIVKERRGNMIIQQYHENENISEEWAKNWHKGIRGKFCSDVKKKRAKWKDDALTPNPTAQHSTAHQKGSPVLNINRIHSELTNTKWV